MKISLQYNNIVKSLLLDFEFPFFVLMLELYLIVKKEAAIGVFLLFVTMPCDIYFFVNKDVMNVCVTL